MPFFIIRDSASKSERGVEDRIVGVDNRPFETYEEAYAIAEKRYPGIKFSIIEAETARDALSRASGVEFPPFKGE